MKRRGFTLLELLVATLIMGVAVVALLSNLSTSLRNASRLIEQDRAAALARARLDELLADRTLPRAGAVEGRFAPELTGGVDAGWTARIETFEAPPVVAAGTRVLERIVVEVWWMVGEQRRSMSVEGFRQAQLTAADVGTP